MTFREINSKPIYWRDKNDVVHSCEGAEVHRGMSPLLWTRCQRDVPANTAFHPKSTDAVTCPTCKAADDEAQP